MNARLEMGLQEYIIIALRGCRKYGILNSWELTEKQWWDNKLTYRREHKLTKWVKKWIKN